MPKKSAKSLTPKEKFAFRDLLQKENEVIRQAALEDLWFFETEILWPSVSDYHYQKDIHQPLADKVSQAAKGSRTLILWPRGHRKTYIATVGHVVWRVLRDPNVRILVISESDSKAKSFLRTIKTIFQHNEGLKEFFPEFHVPATKQFGDQYAFIHPMRSQKELIDPTVKAAYLGSPLAGGRCDIAVFDDPIEKRHVTTPEQADKAVAWFNDTIPVVDKTSPDYNMIFVIGTRWAYNDLYAALLGENRGEDATEDLRAGGLFDVTVRHCLEDASGEADINGTPFFHKRFTRQSLLDIMEEYRADPKAGEEDWWKQYMNICQSPSGLKFLPAWLDNWVEVRPPNIVRSFIAVDSATKDEQVLLRGDYTAAFVGHFDAHGHLYLEDAAHSNALRSMDLMRELQRLSTHHGVFNILKEKVGEEMFFGQVRQHYTREGLPVPNAHALSVRGKGKKVVRVVEALQGPFQRGEVHFIGDPQRKTGFPYQIWAALRDELTHIGQWAHDDLADALSLFFHKDVRETTIPFTATAWTPHVQRANAFKASRQGFNQFTPSSEWTNRASKAYTLQGDGCARPDPFTQQAGIIQPISFDVERDGDPK